MCFHCCSSVEVSVWVWVFCLFVSKAMLHSHIILVPSNHLSLLLSPKKSEPKNDKGIPII